MLFRSLAAGDPKCDTPSLDRKHLHSAAEYPRAPKDPSHLEASASHVVWKPYFVCWPSYCKDIALTIRNYICNIVALMRTIFAILFLISFVGTSRAQCLVTCSMRITDNSQHLPMAYVIAELKSDESNVMLRKGVTDSLGLLM